MLRASSEALGGRADPRAAVDLTVDPGVPGGRELLALTDAVVLGDDLELPVARQATVKALGPEAAARAVTVAGNFQMMNRCLDAVGARVTARLRPMADHLGVEIPAHLRG